MSDKLSKTRSGPSWIDLMRSRAKPLGLAVRGACQVSPGEFDHPGLSRSQLSTILLLGFTGTVQWPEFAASPEAADGLLDPLDRWSRRRIDPLATEFNARAIYPSDVPTLPFQQLARRCEAVFPSPIGLLIHTEWGLWHAYRGALIFPQPLALPEALASTSPCVSCATKPCLHTCPVDAFDAGHYNLEVCVRHVSSDKGTDCRELGCRARRACPIGNPSRYVPEQAQFHMRAFLRTFSPATPG
jgi:hypothetical protein